MYKISIIMPIFNVEEYIERSFNSILNQTMDLNDIEVIMVDDCSTDTTRQIVKEYEKKYSNFKAVYHEKNSGGCAVPRNSGLKVATGEYVMFLDPDDEFDTKMCETLYTKIKNSDAQIVRCNHKLISPTETKIDYQYDKNISEVEINCKTDLPPKTSSVCNTIHSKEFLEKHNIIFPEINNGEDITFSINEFFNANKMIILNNYAGYYYYTNPNLSHSKKATSENFDIILDSYILAKETIEKYDKTEIYKPFFSKRCSQFFLRILDYEGDKKFLFIKFYEFEKSLKCTLDFEFGWMNIVNKILMKNHVTTAILVFNGFNFIRKTPIINVYRKFL